MSKNRLTSISDQQSPGHKDLSSFTDSKNGRFRMSESVRRYVLLSSPPTSTLGLSASRPLGLSALDSQGVVGLTGLEPVTLRLSSACSNQLSYRPQGPVPSFQTKRKWRHGDSNPRPIACKATALPTELCPLG